MCSSLGQELIEEDIKEQGLTRIVVAACSPHMHEKTFRAATERGGLNPYLFEMANIRNHCSWVHSDDWDVATVKAKDLLRMSVAKAALLEPRQTVDVPVTQTALVVGGGVAGMTAATSLAEQGFPVHLVEKEKELGGTCENFTLPFPVMIPRNC